MTLKQSILLAARLIVGAVLIYSGASKALAPSAEFAAALGAYRILPADLIPVIAQVWPWVELLSGTYLFFGYFTRIFAGAAAGMFGLFLIVLGSAVARGIDLASCGCFGAGITLSPKTTFGLDVLFLILAGLIFAKTTQNPPYSADSWINK